jgi:ABC-type sugar transport system permease subunit
MAIILNQKMPGRTVFRAIFFLPVILSTGIIAAIDSAEGSVGDLMNNNTVDANIGEENFMSAMDIEALLSNMELGSGLVDIVVGLVNNIFDIISRSGVQMLIFLSGLQSISPSIYESCQVEGASAWETFWKITLPMVSPMILVNSIYTVIDAFTSVDNRVMSNVTSEMNRTQDALAIQSGHAMAWLYIALVLVVILAVGLLMKAFVFYQKRD